MKQDLRRNFSLSQRLMLQLLAGVAALWLLGVGVAAYVISHELNETFDENLRQSAIRFLPLVVHDLHEISEGELVAVSTSIDEDAFLSFYVLDAAGKLVLTPDDLPTEAISTSPNLGFFDFAGKRYFALADNDSGITIVVIETDHHRAEIIWQSIVSLLVPLAAILPLMAILIWFAVNQVMKPVTRLRAEIAERGADNLSAAETATYPRELAPIASEVNELLARLRDALDAERSFAASSAHELRTPIAGAIAQIQRLQSELEGSQQLSRAKDVEQSLQRLARLSERLLQFARLEAGFAKSEKGIDLVPIVDLVCADFDRKDPSGDLEVKLDQDSRLFALIDPDAFAIALRNLIENAQKYREGDSKIVVRISQKNALIVENVARKFEPGELEGLTKPFARGSTTSPGTGIGLAIVATIAKQVGGKFKLNSIKSETGFVFQAMLELPPISQQIVS